MTGAPAAASRGRIPLVYVLAASHSGSTLLTLLLGSHPDLCTVGELKLTSLGDIDRYRCGCGAPLRACSFWSEVVNRVRARCGDFDLAHSHTHFALDATPLAKRLLAPLHRRPPLEMMRDAALHCTPGWRRHLARAQKTNVALARAVLELTGRQALIDSSKIGIRLKYLLRNPEFDIKVVRLVRDGRAVALTYMNPFDFADARNPALRGGGHGQSRDAERLPMRLAAREWRRANEEADAILRRLAPGRFIEARYEDLCARPEATLARIFAFLGVPAMTPQALAGATRQRHVIGNGMRLDWDGSIRLDERWRQVLDSEALAEFESVAGSMNRRLGYAAAAAPMAIAAVAERSS